MGAHDGCLCLCDWIIGDRVSNTLRRLNRFLQPPQSHDNEYLLEMARTQLNEFFAGKLQRFDIPLDTRGTDFQRRVWEALHAVSYGATATYREIAESAGCPSAVRAVASAIGANPLSIFIPCHRIIGTDGSLTGYAGGLEAKKYLLLLESQALPTL